MTFHEEKILFKLDFLFFGLINNAKSIRRGEGSDWTPDVAQNLDDLIRMMGNSKRWKHLKTFLEMIDNEDLIVECLGDPINTGRCPSCGIPSDLIKKPDSDVMVNSEKSVPISPILETPNIFLSGNRPLNVYVEHDNLTLETHRELNQYNIHIKKGRVL